MKRLVRTTFYGSVAAAALFAATGPSFAIEPGDFQATLRGATIGIPLGALPPPGLYGALETFVGANDAGVGQNGAAEGANQGHGLTVFGEAIVPSLLWVPGWDFLGANVGFAVIQPLFTVAGLQTNCSSSSCNGTAPIAFGNGSFFENVHNTVWASTLSWNFKNGWFVSAGFNFQGPDGSEYLGTLNDDYWTYSPVAAIAYIDKEWKLAVNFEYDIHTASAGKTGTYAALQQAGALPASLAQAIGNGYTSGDQLFIDWSAEYRWGKLAFGPAGYFKYQPTADTPGGGFTCASLTATLGPSLSCGRATDVALGGIIGYDFGPAELEVYAIDSVYTKDDFAGASVFTRLSFKLDNPAPASAPAPAPAPMTMNSK
jgi:hypothetical protein